MCVRTITCVVAIALATMSARAEPSALWQACTGGQEEADGQIKACTAVIDSPGTSRADRAIALNHRGAAWLVKGNMIILGNPRREFEHAIDDFTQAIRLNPKFRDAYLNRGYAWYSARDWERAIADYTAAIKIDPDYARSYQLRLELYRAQGDDALAIGDLTQLIRLDPNNPELYYERGLRWEDRGDPERAIADWTHALKLDPKLLNATLAIAGLLSKRGEFDRALAVYTAAIEADRESSDLFAERGFLLFLRGDFGAAASDFNEAIKLSPSNTWNELRAPLRYVARVRAGQEANEELAALVAFYKGLNDQGLHVEIEPVLELYLGRIKPESVLETAGDSLRGRCNADFLVGEWHLIHDNREAARQHLQAATHERCDGVHYTYRAARVELNRMKP